MFETQAEAAQQQQRVQGLEHQLAELRGRLVESQARLTKLRTERQREEAKPGQHQAAPRSRSKDAAGTMLHEARYAHEQQLQDLEAQHRAAKTANQARIERLRSENKQLALLLQKRQQPQPGSALS